MLKLLHSLLSWLLHNGGNLIELFQSLLSGFVQLFVQNVQLWPAQRLLIDYLNTFSDHLLQLGLSGWNDGVCALVFRLYIWAWIIDFLVKNTFWDLGSLAPGRVQSDTDVIGC
jgi:hypothetical protein